MAIFPGGDQTNWWLAACLPGLHWLRRPTAARRRPGAGSESRVGRYRASQRSAAQQPKWYEHSVYNRLYSPRSRGQSLLTATTSHYAGHERAERDERALGSAWCSCQAFTRLQAACAALQRRGSPRVRDAFNSRACRPALRRPGCGRAGEAGTRFAAPNRRGGCMKGGAGG